MTIANLAFLARFTIKKDSTSQSSLIAIEDCDMKTLLRFATIIARLEIRPDATQIL